MTCFTHLQQVSSRDLNDEAEVGDLRRSSFRFPPENGGFTKKIQPKMPTVLGDHWCDSWTSKLHHGRNYGKLQVINRYLVWEEVWGM